MKKVKCISERETRKGQLVVGGTYWIDESSAFVDVELDEYANIYADEAKTKFIGTLNTEHFSDSYEESKNGI